MLEGTKPEHLPERILAGTNRFCPLPLILTLTLTLALNPLIPPRRAFRQDIPVFVSLARLPAAGQGPQDTATTGSTGSPASRHQQHERK